jgi:cystathionine beta-lyase
LSYGAQGNPTHHQLENVIADIEGGTRCQLVSTGLAAVTMALLAYLKAGDHCLMPDSVYGPARRFCETFAKDFGIETTYYDPEIDEAGITKLIQPNTTVLYTESPGSHTMEVQDVPMLARVAQKSGAKLLMDNTWGVHFFQPFAHGVDCSIQAATKYISGHSDLLLGSITVDSDKEWERVRRTCVTLGQYASPDDCWLALRGVRTLELRLEKHMKSALAVAEWLRSRPEVVEVLYPALPGARGHALWKRDFTGACGLFSVVFDPRFDIGDIARMVESLKLFGLGASWGGFESLALPSTGSVTRSLASTFKGPICRFNIGLEDVGDLIADLTNGMAVLNRKSNQ